MDILERLRSVQNTSVQYSLGSDIMRDAANEIESLRAQLDAARTELALKTEGLERTIAAMEKDAERIDWLEEQARQSRTGISFDYCKYAEEGVVLEKGFRFMRRHFLGNRCDTLRKAIDAARAKGDK